MVQLDENGYKTWNKSTNSFIFFKGIFAQYYTKNFVMAKHI